MFGFSKFALASFTVGTSLLMAGCASNSPPQSTMEMSGQAMTCTKCQVTWVKEPVANDKGRIVAYKWGKQDTCPDCMDAVKSFMNTGKMEHTCKTCGDALQVCESHPQ